MASFKKRNMKLLSGMEQKALKIGMIPHKRDTAGSSAECIPIHVHNTGRFEKTCDHDFGRIAYNSNYIRHTSWEVKSLKYLTIN